MLLTVLVISRRSPTNELTAMELDRLQNLKELIRIRSNLLLQRVRVTTKKRLNITKREVTVSIVGWNRVLV